MGIFMKYLGKHQPDRPLPTQTPELTAFCSALWSIPSDHRKIPNWPIQWLVFSPYPTSPLLSIKRTTPSWKFFFPWFLRNCFFPLLSHLLYNFFLVCFRSTSLSSLELRSLHPHKPFVTYNLLLGDQFNSHEFIYHLISLKSLFLTLIPSWTLGLKPTGQPFAIFCRPFDCRTKLTFSWMPRPSLFLPLFLSPLVEIILPDFFPPSPTYLHDHQDLSARS